MDGTAGESSQAAQEVKVEPRIIEIGVVPAQAAPEVEKKEEAKTAAVAGLEEDTDPAQVEEQRNPKKSMQDRIDEITRARREAEREAEYWKARAGAHDQQKGQQGKPDPDARPARDGFKSDEDYHEALTDWKLDQRLAQRDQQQAQSKQAEAKATSWNDRLMSARGEITDYNQVVNAVETPVANHVAEALMEHEHGAKVMYDLAKNPELLEKMNGLSPTGAAFEIAKLAVKHDKSGSSEASPPPKPAAVSKAPPPPAAKVGASRSTTPDLGDLGMEDYVKRRREQGAGWARR